VLAKEDDLLASLKSPVNAPRRAPPSLADLVASEPDGWPDDAEAEELVGDWRIYQRRRGHRASTDDVLTAWMAVRLAGGAPARYVDLGCGIGSVLLLTAHRLRPGSSLGVEAQAQSALMARRSVAELPGAPPIAVEHADLRAVSAERHGLFDLVTGSPPYFPVGTGVLSADAQRRACRFELRGGVEAYCEAAARVLTPDGAFALVFPTDGDARVLAAAARSALHLRARADLFMREDRGKPFLTVYGLGRTAAPPASWSFAIRTAAGEVTEAYRAARAELGLR
jgi:tRNA1Val (adenine37-N6)-methyltransferase